MLLPLLVRMALRHFAPAVAQRLAPVASGFGHILLLAGVIPILIAALAWDRCTHRQRDNPCHRSRSHCGIDRRPFAWRARAGRPGSIRHCIFDAAPGCRARYRQCRLSRKQIDHGRCSVVHTRERSSDDPYGFWCKQRQIPIMTLQHSATDQF